MGKGGSFFGGKVSTEVKKNVALYIQSPIHLHGIVLNYLSTGTVLPFTDNIYVKKNLNANMQKAPSSAERKNYFQWSGHPLRNTITVMEF
jgi:hypothetical protein